MPEQPKHKAAEIRFDGFDESWNTSRLDEAATVERGKFTARPRNDPKYFGGDIPFVQTGDVVHANRRLRNFSQTLNDEGLSVSKVFPANTILITIAANIGDLAITDFPVACPDSVVAIKPDEGFDTAFLFAVLGTKKSDLEAEATTNAQANINLQILEPLEICAPELPEQRKIGSYFKSLDRMIGLHQRKHDKLVTLKQAMLQKMFPQDGATTPEIRFKGFDKPWGPKRFDDVATLINGRAYSQHELLDKGRYPVLRVGNFYTNSSWYYSDMELGDKYYAENGDFLYTWSASFGPHIWNGEKVIYHYHIWKVELSEMLEKGFALQLLQIDRERILSTSSGSTMIHLTKEGMESKEFMIPSPKEQEKIGIYFGKLDKLISKHATQLEKLKNIKSACLEKMFV